MPTLRSTVNRSLKFSFSIAVSHVYHKAGLLSGWDLQSESFNHRAFSTIFELVFTPAATASVGADG